MSGIPGGPGREPVKGVPGVPGDPGHLAVKFYNLRRQQWSNVTIPTKNGNFSFDVENVNVNLKSGTLTVAAYSDEVVQNLCLAFTIAVLQVSILLSSMFILLVKPIEKRTIG